MEKTTVLIADETIDLPVVQVPVESQSIEQLLEKEWLLTNHRGGYASSTIIGCNIRSYHGLLIGALDPPANRILALSNCLEEIAFGGRRYDLSTFEFADTFAPCGVPHLQEFRRDIGVHYEFRFGPLRLCKSVYLTPDSDMVVLVYSFRDASEPVDFTIRPFVAMRDFHYLQRSNTPMSSTILPEGVLVRADGTTNGELLLRSPSMVFEQNPAWWFGFVYRENRQRGQDYREDLWTPGVFRCHIEYPQDVVFYANLSLQHHPGEYPDVDPQKLCGELSGQSRDMMAHAKASDDPMRLLCMAADQFVVRRAAGGETILAGYPWFADWGRDTFISLPGLLLETGRFDEARSVLSTFAAAVDGGMIPNRFDDRSQAAHFNSVDASLWFIHAVYLYLQATGDRATVTEFWPAVKSILRCYTEGTRFGIHADGDGLITAGDDQTQLTWMDAMCDGVAFTPRAGKAVEVNALWHNALCIAAHLSELVQPGSGLAYLHQALRVGRSFCQVFWNESVGFLNDCIGADGLVDATLRPNQIFAVSLPFGPPLSGKQQRQIVEAVEKELLTPYGLRTLPVSHRAYHGRYEGPQRLRDEAYHQGTVWAYLMGPFVEAILKASGYSSDAKCKAAGLLEPILEHLTSDGCLGSVSEIFDGDPPHKPRGCIAQAWSVGELLRAYRLVQG